MKRSTKIMIATGVAIVALGSIGSVVIAKGNDWHQYGRSHQGMMGGGMMAGGMHGQGMTGSPYQMMDKMFKRHDLDNDGTVTQAEVDQQLQNMLNAFDENRDGLLDLSEFQKMWMQNNRERIVDRFQAHDDDGDGRITKDEFMSPMAGIIARHDLNDDGKISMKEIQKQMRGWGHGRNYDNDDDNKSDNK